jgi:hypothetical protein
MKPCIIFQSTGLMPAARIAPSSEVVRYSSKRANPGR